eukprot:XP_001706970.1 Hypothetical protein GL50803_31189 [Giardia lamblia ATCC 50803]
MDREIPRFKAQPDIVHDTLNLDTPVRLDGRPLSLSLSARGRSHNTGILD